jgi:hypothetical protein
MNASQVNDLVISVHPDIEKWKFTDIMTDRQDFIAMDAFRDPNKIEKKGGPTYGWNVVFTYNDNAQDIGLYASINPSSKDTVARATGTFHRTITDFVVDEFELDMAQENPEQIFDLVKPRDAGSQMSMAERLEKRFWGLPSTSTTNPNQFRGLPYWIMWAANQTVNGVSSGGFWGKRPTGFTDCAGLDPNGANYSRWANYCDTYVTINKDDLVMRGRKATMKTNFKSPLRPELAGYDTGEYRAQYTSLPVIDGMTVLLEAQNDNLGKEASPFQNAILFFGNPLIWVPELDLDLSIGAGYPGAPIIGVDWATFKIVSLDPASPIKKHEPILVAGEHRVWSTVFELRANLKCHNRRKNWILATAQPW